MEGGEKKTTINLVSLVSKLKSVDGRAWLHIYKPRWNKESCLFPHMARSAIKIILTGVSESKIRPRICTFYACEVFSILSVCLFYSWRPAVVNKLRLEILHGAVYSAAKLFTTCAGQETCLLDKPTLFTRPLYEVFLATDWELLVE